jgi:hypothetical protein
LETNLGARKSYQEVKRESVMEIKKVGVLEDPAEFLEAEFDCAQFELRNM